MEDDHDDDLADFAGLADELLRYQREQEDERLGINELAADLLGHMGGPPPQLNTNEQEEEQEPNDPLTLDPLQIALQQPDLTLLYGKPEAVRNLGDRMQLKIMNRVYAELSRQSRQGEGPGQSQRKQSALAAGPKPKQLQDVTHTAVIDHFVLSTKTITMSAAASIIGVDFKSVKLGVHSTAALTLLGGTWLIGALLNAWRQASKSLSGFGAQQNILFLTRMKYDETPLRLKVSEFNELFALPLRDGRNASSSSRQTSHQEEYKYAKIFRILFKLGILD